MCLIKCLEYFIIRYVRYIIDLIHQKWIRCDCTALEQYDECFGCTFGVVKPRFPHRQTNGPKCRREYDEKVSVLDVGGTPTTLARHWNPNPCK